MRPYIICHMCTTIDGKVLSKRWGKLAGSKSSSSLFETTAASFKIPAWLVGTTTMKEFSGRPVKLKAAKIPLGREDFIANAGTKNFAIGVDAKAALRFQKPEVEGDHVVLLVTNKASNNYLSHLRDAGVSYLICGKANVDLKVAMHKLYTKCKIQKLMLQGGGTFNGSMLDAGLVDEVSQVIVPIIDGGPSVTGFFDIVNNSSTKSSAHLKFKSHKLLPGGVNWLRYAVR